MKKKINWKYIKSIMPTVRVCGTAGYPETTPYFCMAKRFDSDDKLSIGRIVGGYSNGTESGTRFRVRFYDKPNPSSLFRHPLDYSESWKNVSEITFCNEKGDECYV
jgi:hypothetical protein